jgi:hypothetical protein
MTMDEFKKRMGELFRRYPRVPVVVDMTDGTRHVIDGPEQYNATGNTQIALMPTSKPHMLVKCENVTGVQPLDELPPEPGRMGYADFYATIRPLLWAEPFESFEIEFYHGERLRIESSGRLALAGRIGVYRSGDRRGLISFTYDQVSRIIRPEAAPVG